MRDPRQSEKWALSLSEADCNPHTGEMWELFDGGNPQGVCENAQLSNALASAEALYTHY